MLAVCLSIAAVVENYGQEEGCKSSGRGVSDCYYYFNTLITLGTGLWVCLLWWTWYTVHPPIGHIFISRKSVDKSGFVDKSGEMWQIGSVGDFIRAKFSSTGSNVWKYYLIFKTNKKLMKINLWLEEKKFSNLRSIFRLNSSGESPGRVSAGLLVRVKKSWPWLWKILNLKKRLLNINWH